MLMFDLTRYSTFVELEEWRVTIGKYVKGTTPILLVGCKDDLCEQNSKAQEIQDEVAKQYLEKHNFLEYIKTSAKTGKNIEKCFQVMAGRLIPAPMPHNNH